MLLRHVLEVLDAVDTPDADGEAVRALFDQRGGADLTVERVEEAGGRTDFVRLTVSGATGARAEGSSPTLGVVGRLGGLGARPEQIGYVSDGDGAVAALAAGLALVEAARRGDQLPGDVVVCTHVCPDAPTQPREPVPFMGSPVDMDTMNRLEVSADMDGVLSIDTTKGNRLVNHRGIAVSPPVKGGWILRPTDDVLDVYEQVTGLHPVLLPITMQDLTPYANGLPHINSIMQPWLATDAPVIGVAVTAEAPVPGSATGASHEADIALAATFAVEVAKGFGDGRVSLYHEDEYQELARRYGTFSEALTTG